MTVIDLGEVRQGPEAAELPPRPSLSLRVRRGLAALGAAVALVAAGGAAPVRGHLVEVVLPMPVHYAFAGEDFASDGVVYVGGSDTLASYELPGLRQRWRVPLPGPGGSQARRAFVTGDAVLIMGDGPASDLVALDAETGERRWRRPGMPGYSDDDRVLVTYQEPGDSAMRYEMVDLATGRVRWELTAPGAEQAFYDEDRFVRWSPTGQVEVRDLRTGRVRATGTVPPPDPDAVLPDDGARGPAVQMVGDLLLVARQRAGQAMADAYDLEGFARRWTAMLDLGRQYLDDCGDLVCVNYYSGVSGVRAIEADTGRVRWSNDHFETAYRFGPVLLAYASSTRPPRMMIVDPANGRPRVDLGTWEPSWSVLDDRRLLAVRPDVGGDTWVTVLDLVAGTIRTLGVVHGARTCDPSGAVVVCQRGAVTTLWYPRRRLNE